MATYCAVNAPFKEDGGVLTVVSGFVHVAEEEFDKVEHLVEAGVLRLLGDDEAAEVHAAATSVAPAAPTDTTAATPAAAADGSASPASGDAKA